MSRLIAFRTWAGLIACLAVVGGCTPAHRHGTRSTVAPRSPTTTETEAYVGEHSTNPIQLSRSGIGVVATYDEAKQGENVVAHGHLLVTFDVGGHWRDVTPPDALPGYLDALFLDRRHGWAVSWECGAKTLLHRTVDGGHSWQTTEPTSAGCHAGAGLALEFVDDVHGWIASWDPVAQGHGTLLRTSDGGVTWVALSSPQQGPVTFIDRRRGWSSPGDGPSRNEVYETSDGGLTWRRREIGIGGPGEEPAFGRPRFFDGRTGVMPVTIVHGDTVDVVFLATGDGGENWRQRGRLATGATAGPSHGVGEVSVAAVSPSMWWVAAYAGGRPRLWVTEDEGSTYANRAGVGIPTQQQVSYPRINGPGSTTLPSATLGDVRAFDGSTAWLSVSEDRHTDLLVTHDGGASWAPLVAG